MVIDELIRAHFMLFAIGGYVLAFFMVRHAQRMLRDRPENDSWVHVIYALIIAVLHIIVIGALLFIFAIAYLIKFGEWWDKKDNILKRTRPPWWF